MVMDDKLAPLDDKNPERADRGSTWVLLRLQPHVPYAMQHVWLVVVHGMATDA